ncbi:class I SAM-dependent methyltransferase [Verticiella sediminum]|uniref:Class I SAM-dependent methyltransferase n=1 Tax=Verticiella sediminum TaxID=1247510 RepID=A0A556A7C2_9BURK|nr:class I SAM-dependent methyltransferase [Verticiella sediminum]TSH88781.1 class I SAM-dependent methyltransferase [Verticiella sediminum]
MLPPVFARSRRLLAHTLGACALLGSGVALAADKPLDVPYVPTPQQVVDRMLELGEVSQETYVIDLGSGDGRIPVTAARQYQARAMGVDLNPQRISEANENAKKAGVTDKVEFKQQDLFETPIGEAQVLTMYLLPRVNLQLRPRILEEMTPGSRVVSHAFDMAEWEPDARESVDGRTVYLWIVPAQVQGTWNVQPAKGEPFTVTFEQEFQQVSGKANVGGKEVELVDATLRGDRLSFGIDGETYEARVTDEGLQGAGGWRATKA